MWIEAIVMPRETGYRPPPPSKPNARGARASTGDAARVPFNRRPAWEAACEESRGFRDRVVAFLQVQHLMGAVRWISEPGCLPQVTLHCTTQVLERLRQAPEFEAGMSMPIELHT